MGDAAELIRRYCTQADQKAFRAFYIREAPRLWRFFVARGCDADTAHDLLSESFLRFIQVVCKNPAAPLPLLYRIALNLRIDLHRRAQHRPVNLDPEVLTMVPDSTSDPAGERDVLKAMQTLHGDEQNLLLMRYWIGLTHAEIAAALGLPEGTVRRQAAAALHKLRAQLEP
ncbi:MAG: RNA polymerase sigma factor [Pseudomonadota bacterium]